MSLRQLGVGVGMEMELELEMEMVVNAADNPAHHLQLQLQLVDQHTNAFLKNH